MSGWSEGTCLIKGTCSGSAETVAWHIAFETQKITLIPVPDEPAYFCQSWPFGQSAKTIHDVNLDISTLDGKDIVSENVSYPFNQCTRYESAPPGEDRAIRHEAIFGNSDFVIGLPEGWQYIRNSPSGLRGILHDGKFVDISTNQPVFTGEPYIAP